MAGQHRPRKIVKVAMATLAPIFLPRRLGEIPSLLRYLGQFAVRAAYPRWPAQLPDHFVTLGIVQ